MTSRSRTGFFSAPAADGAPSGPSPAAGGGPASGAAPGPGPGASGDSASSGAASSADALKVDYIFELGVEEMPAGYFGPAASQLRDELARALEAARLPFGSLEAWAGPRRLAAGIRDLAAMQPDFSQEVTGPPLASAFDANGNPTKAAEGFAKGQGVPVSEVFTLQTKKGPYLAVRKTVAGRPAGEILAEALPAILGSLKFPKTMIWGEGEHRFARPAHWILSVLGGDLLPLEFAGIRAGAVSYGHRFLSPGPLSVSGPGEYAARLAEARVLAGFEDRHEAVLAEIAGAVESSGLDLSPVVDPDLAREVANLVEEPAAVLGSFDPGFLDLPLAVSATAMQEHQRYFPVLDRQGRQAPNFIAVNNTRARDMDVVRRGHERVLRARLEDARFYYLDDRKASLASRSPELSAVVFHSLLGTYAEKTERVSRLAADLAREVAPDLRDTVMRAAELSKCDLVTGVVKEFPSLQGVMGREYALLDGEPPEVAEAIAEQYMPVRAGGPLPATPAGAILAAADKLDTVCGCFSVGLDPTGGSDPFALRRQALGVLLTILDRGWRLSLDPYVERALAALSPFAARSPRESRDKVMEFFSARLKTHLLDQGVSADGAEAVLCLHGGQPLSALQRALALEGLKRRDGFRDLAQTFKRVVNIIRKFGGRDLPVHPASLSQDAEKRLLEAVAAVDADTARHLHDGDFAGLIDRVAALKGPVDAFFDEVLVDDPDESLKTARIALLNRTASLFELIADFSKISTL